MIKLILSVTMILILSGCLSDNEVRETIESLQERKVQAVEVISTRNFSLDGLLKAQDYFFDFSEKVHLMKEDEKARDSIKKLIKNNGATEFCNNFVVPARVWQALDNQCRTAGIYKCSADIQEYMAVQSKFHELIGVELSAQLRNEPSCN